jgi:hypothetical protein
MEMPSIRSILNRIVFYSVLLGSCYFGYKFVIKLRRQAAIASELQSITSDSSFFHQFYAEDARKTLVRAIGLVAEANALGVPPDEAIDRGLGMKQEFFENDAEHDEPPVREKIIRNCLRGNYENFLKLGYTSDPRTLDAMHKGELPPIPSGPHSGHKVQIANLIEPSISPGMEKVIANLEIRPPADGKRKLSEIEIAAAKQFVRDLAAAQIIEDPVADRIIQALAKSSP